MRIPHYLFASLCLSLLLPLLGGCASHAAHGGRGGGSSIYARLTGEGASSPIDTWNPEITEASQKFHLRPSWIRAVMMQESGGHQYMHGHLIRSKHGAVGLMQLKPSTYHVLAQRYHLGKNPYEPRNNIMAGTAYMKELYNRFGSPAFLAAYTGGPGCVLAYRDRGVPLPDYARSYMDNVGKHLDDSSLEQTADSYISDSNLPEAERDTEPTFAQRRTQALGEARSIAPSMEDDVDDTPDDNQSYDFRKPEPTSDAPPLDEMKQRAIAQIHTKEVRGVDAVDKIASTTSMHPLTLQAGSFSSLARARHSLQTVQGEYALNGIHHQIEKLTFDNGHTIWRVRYTGISPRQREHVCRALSTHHLSCIAVH